MGVDIRILVPRVRRALEGAGTPEVLTGDAIKDIVADAIASVILYSSGSFGKDLNVTDTDEDTGAPSEYETSEALTLAEQTMIASQAALDYFFFQYGGVKISERVTDEGSTWEYGLSATLLRDQLKHLIAERDAALEEVSADSGASLEKYSSFLQVRDAVVAERIEPWTTRETDVPGAFGGQ